MKTTRPVFESFSAFVSNLYEMELAYPGSIESLMENELIQDSLLKGNSYSLPDLIKIEGTLTHESDRVPFKEAVRNLQISASSNSTAAEKLKEFSTQIRNLSSEPWINKSKSALFDTEIISETAEAPYLYGDSGNVEVKGAPSMSDMTKIEGGIQYMSYSQMLALVAAYNASIFIKNLEIQKKNIDSPKEVKKIIKGKEKIYEKMPLANPKDQLVVTITEGSSQIVITSIEKLNPELIPAFRSLDYGDGTLTDPMTGQFKYMFPVITDNNTSDKVLSIETRQKIVAPDKSKSSSEVTDLPLAIEESGKATFYVTNEADLTDAGKAAAASLTRMFSKITKVVVEGSADKRTAGSPWKDNNELASARRDKMMEYLKELAGDSNSSLSGADIAEGSVSVQPKDGLDTEMASWRAVKIKVSGSIYDETKNALPKGDDKEPKKITYSEVKKGRAYKFTNCLISYAYDDSELASDTKQFGSK
jgi:flagellar motor protein MotB